MNDLTQGQAAVLSAFYEFGSMTDVALAVYVHHMSEVSMSSSGVRTRRAELVRHNPPLLQVIGTKVLKSGRKAAIHALTEDGLVVATDLFLKRTGVLV